MGYLKKLFSGILVCAILFCVTACTPEPQEEVPSEPALAEYSVTVRSMGGMALEGIEVFVYEDAGQKELAGFGQTDETGAAVMLLPESDSYCIVLESVPEGYAPSDSYRFDGHAVDITLRSQLIEGESLSGAQLGVGHVMYDFEVTAADGSTVKLSDMLAEKDMVLLNFWFSTCGPCASEFPYMQQAYESYADSVGIVALNPLEDSPTVATYQQSMGLTFPMAACPAAWSQTFGITGYPTSIVIDRYGVICLAEVGAITSLRPFEALFAHFTAEDYTQGLYGSVNELITTVKPTYAMASSEAVSAILGSTDLPVTYRPETDPDSAEYAWPFIEAEKNGEVCLKASNINIEGSYAILYADVTLEKGQAVAFDYLASSEKGCDVLYVIVNDQDVYAISGWDEEEVWKTCYPWVAAEDGTYEVALCYLKDGDTNEADDTVYIKNLHIADAASIDSPAYIPQLAAASEDGFTYSYADIHYNTDDGYYHVGSENGPLLLADMMNYTQFSEEKTLWELVYSSSITLDGVHLYDAMVNHFSYASNAAIYGMCTVDQTLFDYLQIVDEHFGFDENDPNEWLKLCTYYAAYGTDVQLADPIGGLATYSAFEAKLGVGIETNCFYYDRPIMPRGLLAKFVPTRSGVYRITSHTDSENGVEGWIFGEDRAAGGYTYAADQRMLTDVLNCYMYYYMEAGQAYYIDIAFWDIYEIGTIYYDIEYVAAEHELFRLASPGYFTYDTGATGEDMYHLISGGIDVVLGEDGIYYEDLGNGKTGSKLYCDFTGITGVFSDPIASVQAYGEDGKLLFDADGQPVIRKGLIEKGGFDFSKTENDQYILTILAQHGGDTEAADEYLRDLWGADYDANAKIYQLKDVFAGRCHGQGEDCTAQMEAFLDDIITTGPAERRGCVVVTRELAELLQLLMDKFTFSGVDHSWTKLCYYYDHLGPNP